MIFRIVSNVYKLRGDVKSLENRKKKHGDLLVSKY